MSRPAFGFTITLGSFVLLDLGMGFRVETDEEPDDDGPPVEFGFATPCEALEAGDPVFRDQIATDFPLEG